MSKVYSRKQWGARYGNGFGTRKLPAKRVFLHHSVTSPPPTNATFSKDAAAVRTLENIGQSRFKRGISYNRVITRSGRIFSGISIGRIGAHTGGYNTTGVGVVTVGNYSSITPPNSMVLSLVWLLRYMRRKGQVVKTAKYEPHRAVSATACPGNKMVGVIPRINALANDNRDYPKRVLKKGAKGGDVRWVQVRLASMGYDVELTGVFDDKTYAATKSFRKKEFSGPQFGNVGPKTWEKLRNR
jgi:hypothetical protein